MIPDYGQHFIFPGCNDDTTVKNIMAQVADLSDQAIYNAIIKAAQEAGVTDLYLMDRTFVLDALREKAERENPKPLTIEELCQMDGEPVWVSELRGWAIVGVPDGGVWDNIPFINTVIQRVSYEWNAEARNLHCYRHKPKEEK